MKKFFLVLLLLMVFFVSCNKDNNVVENVEFTTEQGTQETEMKTETIQNVKSNENNIPVKKVFDYVFDIGTYDSLDYKNAEEYFAKGFDNWEGACTAIAKKLDNGKMLVGRNMDLYISNKAAYIMRTKIDGCYETIGLAYTNMSGPDYKDALNGGISEDFYKVIPFLCCDVFNKEGLYVETNMRNGEYWATGKNEYGCKSTNKDAKERVCSLNLPRYICEHCATVDEAIEYVKTLDIYTPNIEKMNWNFCFMMADSIGHYGILEIAQDEISWLDYEDAQANFYLTKKFQITEDLACGIGRYNLVKKNIVDVKTESDMLNLMKRVNYSKVYNNDEAEFDVRTEFVALKDYWTYDVVSNEDFKDFILDEIRKSNDKIKGKTRQELQDMNSVWETTFTEVVNCTDKKWIVRFYEDDERIITLEF